MRNPQRMGLRLSALAGTCILLGGIALRAAPQTPQGTPRELVRTVIQNGLQDAAANQHVKMFTWKERKLRENETVVEQVVDTPDGFVSRLLLINDKALTPDERAKDDERVRKMTDPAQMRRKLKDRQAADERTRELMSVIPDAFDYTYVDSTQAANGHKLTRLKFVARPGFDPPSRETAVFTGMQGDMLIDETAGRLAKIDGTLFKEVNFGWGILGRLNKGGRFIVEQSEITPTHWDSTRMTLHFDGKVLIFKPIHIEENETAWDFQPVQPMSTQEAMNFLVRSSQSTQNASNGH
jgi:hypothetical protein